MTVAATEVKERPILFSGPMVRAILEGRKTQTRRTVKPMPFIDYPTGFRLQNEYKLEHHPKCSFVQAGMLCDCKAIYEPWKNERIAACPYGRAGDRLWVRETFCPVNDEQFGEKNWIDYRATPRYKPEHPAGWENEPYNPEALKWKPSIFMPRWASRITLEITDVRVERLLDISEADAKAEGVDQVFNGLGFGYPNYQNFKVLWESINAKKHPWSSNPWVWVVEFKRVEV